MIITSVSNFTFKKKEKKEKTDEEHSSAKCRGCGSGNIAIQRDKITFQAFGKFHHPSLCQSCNQHLTDFDVLLTFFSMSQWSAVRSFVYGPEHLAVTGELFHPVMVPDIIHYARRKR